MTTKIKPITSAVVIDETGHAIVGRSANIMPVILDMWAPERACIADLTFGWGNFWTKSPVSIVAYYNQPQGVVGQAIMYQHPDPTAYVFASDLEFLCKGTDKEQWSGIDARHTPYPDGYFDVAIFDPPFAGTGGTGENPCTGCEGTGKNNFTGYGHCQKCGGTGKTKASGSPTVSGYGNGGLGSRSSEKILELYWEAMVEIRRITKPDGLAILKVCDQVESGINRWLHARLMLETPGWVCVDLFYLIRKGVGLRNPEDQQLHSRKNLSHFLIMAKEESRIR